MSAVELLQYANVLVLPALIYIIKLERRMLSLEIRLQIALGLPPGNTGANQAG